MLKLMLALVTAVSLPAACSRPPPEHPVMQQTVQVPQACAPAREFGALPDDQLDDRQPLADALAACARDHGGGVVQLEPGQYEIVTPSRSSGMAPMLTLPDDVQLVGASWRKTTLHFTGDNQRLDYVAIAPRSRTAVRRLALVSEFARGTTAEQTHLIRLRGPLRGFELSDTRCVHPSPGDTKTGDCLQVIGYSQTPTAPDQLVWDVQILRNYFERSDRSFVAVHSGLRGSQLPDGSWTTRVYGNVFADVTDQAIDGEGTGDTDGVRVDHNTFLPAARVESSVVVEMQGWSHVHFHDNLVQDRGLNLYGVADSEFDHNRVTQQVSGAPAVYLRKASSRVVFHDEVYERSLAAGPGIVLALEQRIGAPDHVSVQSTRLVQHALGAALYAAGVVALVVDRLDVQYDGPDGLASRTDGVMIFGSTATRGDLLMTDSTITGPYRAAVRVSGSYAGLSSVEIRRSSAVGQRYGLVCETQTGIGQVSFGDDSWMPPNVCSVTPL